MIAEITATTREITAIEAELTTATAANDRKRLNIKHRAAMRTRGNQIKAALADGVTETEIRTAIDRAEQ